MMMKDRIMFAITRAVAEGVQYPVVILGPQAGEELRKDLNATYGSKLTKGAFPEQIAGARVVGNAFKGARLDVAEGGPGSK